MDLLHKYIYVTLVGFVPADSLIPESSTRSHSVLCISLHLNSQYASQQIKMQKAESPTPNFYSKTNRPDPLQSYCCEVVMEKLYLVLRVRFSEVLNLSSPVGFSDGLSRHHVPLKCQNFSIGLFHQQLLWKKMGFFSV